MPSGDAANRVKEGLSVRATERLVKLDNSGQEKPKPKPGKSSSPLKDADTRALEGDLSAALRMAVSINHEAGTNSGRMVITYRSLDQLDELCNKLSRWGETR